MKRLQGFIAGIIVSCIIFSGILVFAEPIDALFNVVNIKLNGKQVAKIEDYYTLPNGDKVPFSISYKGTTYLPMRKLAELLGKNVGWDNETKTASINDTVNNNEISEEIMLLNYAGYAIKINGKLYSFNQMSGLYKDTEGELYSDKINVSSIIYLIRIVNGDYNINKAPNPYFDGSITVSRNDFFDYYETEDIYYNATQTYQNITIKNKDKSYFISLKPGEEKGVVKSSNSYYIPYNKVFRTLELPITLTYYIDEPNNLLILELKK